LEWFNDGFRDAENSDALTAGLNLLNLIKARPVRVFFIAAVTN